MATYLILNLVFLAAVVIWLKVSVRKPSRRTWVLLAILLVLTAIFDSLIIYFDIVAYDESKLLGIYIGKAPIEDFFYAILAVVIVPHIWNKFDSKKKEAHVKKST